MRSELERTSDWSYALSTAVRRQATHTGWRLWSVRSAGARDDTTGRHTFTQHVIHISRSIGEALVL